MAVRCTSEIRDMIVWGAALAALSPEQTVENWRDMALPSREHVIQAQATACVRALRLGDIVRSYTDEPEAVCRQWIHPTRALSRDLYHFSSHIRTLASCRNLLPVLGSDPPLLISTSFFWPWPVLVCRTAIGACRGRRECG